MYDELREVWAELTGPGGAFEVTEVEVRGQRLRSFASAPASLVDLWRTTAAYRDADYLVYDDERWTYAESHAQVASIAAWLVDQGVAPGDRVAIAMRNYPEWLLAYWAILAVGASVVGMNAWWVAEELAYAVADSTPRAIIADAERIERLAGLPEVEGIPLVAVRCEPPAGGIPWADLLGGPTELPAQVIDTDDDACVFYTSGTTGRPKGARLTHRGCVNNILALAFVNTAFPAALQRARAARGQEGPPPVSGPKANAALVVTPLFHVTANTCVAVPFTLLGGKLVCMYRWDATEALRLIERERITTLSGVPVMSRELLNHPDFAATDTSSLASLGGGGAPLQPDLVRKIDASGPQTRASTGYGMTETCGIITANSHDFYLDKPASAGPAMPDFETRIVDEHGRSLPTGRRGELWVRGAQVIRGYLNRPEETAAAITDGWLHTGDIAYIDDDGFIFLVDRAKDMVLRGGENVGCAEVEAALHHHPAVAECAVIPVPDDRLGEEVGAVVVARPGHRIDPDELRSYAGIHLAAFMVPRHIWVLDEPLPRNASGKFLKRELRERLDIADAR